MKYFGGCDVGSTYTKAVILDENGKMCADTTIRSKINAEQSAIAAMEEVCGKVNEYMRTVMKAEPVDPSLLEFDDDICM